MDDNGAAAAAEQLTSAGLRMLAGTIVDNAGVTRAKVIPAARLRHAAEHGVGLSPVFAVMCADDGITESASYGGPAGDMRLIPDLSAAVLVDKATGLGCAPCAGATDAALQCRLTVPVHDHHVGQRTVLLHPLAAPFAGRAAHPRHH